MPRKSEQTARRNQPAEKQEQASPEQTSQGGKDKAQNTEQANGGAVLSGRRRPGYEPMYHEAVDLYLPLIGSDPLALYVVYLRFRHGDPDTDKPMLKDHAWPGDRRLCSMLGWSRGAKKRKPSRIRRARLMLVAADLITITTVGELLDSKALTPEQAVTLVAQKTSVQALRRKYVILVHDPLDRRAFRRERQAIRKRVGVVESQYPRRQRAPRKAPLGASDAPREDTESTAHPMRQGTAQPVHQGTAQPSRQKQTASNHTDGNDTEQQADAVVAYQFYSSEMTSAKDYLAAYGILEPTLSERQHDDPIIVLAWIMYLDDQERLTPAQRRSILIARLRDGTRPPEEYITLAGISCEQARWLVEKRRYREDRLCWPDDNGDCPVSPDVAETWLRYVLARDDRLYLPPIHPEDEPSAEEQEQVEVEAKGQMAIVPPESQVREHARNALHLLDGQFADRQRAREVIALWHESGLDSAVFREIVVRASTRAKEEYVPGSRVEGFFTLLPRLIQEHLQGATGGAVVAGDLN